ncbi:MAG: hypothetical protein ACPGUD_04420 [Parashewanella sp.]
MHDLRCANASSSYLRAKLHEQLILTKSVSPKFALLPLNDQRALIFSIGDEPDVKLGEKHNISDATMRKLRRALNIPSYLETYKTRSKPNRLSETTKTISKGLVGTQTDQKIATHYKVDRKIIVQLRTEAGVSSFHSQHIASPYKFKKHRTINKR